jgi:excisionase family DNA binding protein
MTIRTGKREPVEVMTVAQVADYLHLHKLTIYRYIREQKLPAIRLGRSFRIMRDDVHRFLDAQRVGTTEKRATHEVPRASTVVSRHTAQEAPDRIERDLDPRRDIVQPRETTLTYNPLDWVNRGLH